MCGDWQRVIPLRFLEDRRCDERWTVLVSHIWVLSFFLRISEHYYYKHRQYIGPFSSCTAVNFIETYSPEPSSPPCTRFSNVIQRSSTYFPQNYPGSECTSLYGFFRKISLFEVYRASNHSSPLLARGVCSDNIQPLVALLDSTLD